MVQEAGRGRSNSQSLDSGIGVTFWFLASLDDDTSQDKRPGSRRDLSGSTSALGLLPVADGLDAVAVGVEQERGVVGRMVVRP